MDRDIRWIDRHDPVQEVAAERWEQGLPLGNGKIGAMVWGGSNRVPLTISIDQAEIWDMRTYDQPKDKTWADYKKLLEKGRGDEVEGFSYGPDDIHTMRIPVGRIELEHDGSITGHTSVVWRGDEAPEDFMPLEGIKSEEHFWGVKRVRRF